MMYELGARKTRPGRPSNGPGYPAARGTSSDTHGLLDLQPASNRRPGWVCIW
jgi:hypothetical protein